MNTNYFVNHLQLLIPLLLSFSISFIKTVETIKDFQKINHRQNYDDLFKFHRSFKTSNNSRIVAQVGSSVILPCSLDDSSTTDVITWIRKSDYKLLTVGTTTYSSDERFHIENVRHRNVRNLRIKSVRKSDEGIYECNLSSHPPRSIHIHLSVKEPIAKIRESPEIFISEGSILKLECKIVNAIENPIYIFWYQNNKMVNFAEDERLSVLTIPQQNYTRKIEESHKFSSNLVDPITSTYHNIDDTLDDDNDNTKNLKSSSIGAKGNLSTNRKSKIFTTFSSSILLINEVSLKHAGNYTCQPSNTQATWIVVHILKNGNTNALTYFAKTRLFAMLKSASSCLSCDFQLVLGMSIFYFKISRIF